MAKNKLLRMDNVGIVVESLDDAISFFEEIGLKLEGRATVEGEWAGRVTGLGSQCVEIAMMVTPDGHSRLELSRFLTPPTISDHRTAPVNALGYLRVNLTEIYITRVKIETEKQCESISKKSGASYKHRIRDWATLSPGNKERGSNCRDTSAPTNRIAAGSKLP